MNFSRTSFVSVALLVLALAAPAFAFHTSNSTPISFDNWDQAMVAGGGQTFNTACGDITVVASGDVTAPSAFGTTMVGGEDALRIDLAPGQAQTYGMTFGTQFPLVIDIDRLDKEEKLTVTSSTGSVTYTHADGMTPEIMNMADGLMITGTAFGGGADGAAIGYITLGASESVTLTYEALSEVTMNGVTMPVTSTKFGGFAFGKAVPEPNSSGLMAFGLFGLLGMGRKSSRRKN